MAFQPQLVALIDIDPLHTCTPDTDRLGTGKYAVNTPRSHHCTVRTPTVHTAGFILVPALHIFYQGFISAGPAGSVL